MAVPAAAVVSAGIGGALLLAVAGADPWTAYRALANGALGDAQALGRTLEKATPLLFNGLAVAFAFKAGLFNIGAQGQLLLGAVASAAAGSALAGLGGPLPLLLALAAGAAAGALPALAKGLLKAHSGAHEVITGIMFNYVAINLTDYLAAGPLRDPAPGNIVARTALVADTARLPDWGPVPAGVVMALALAPACWALLRFSTFGFALRTVGANARAAHCAGIGVNTTLVLTMAVSGALAGAGGAVETLGVMGRFQPGFQTGLGFDGITVALLARVHPLGVVPAAIGVGAMKAGAGQMQFAAGVATEIVDLLLAMLLVVAAGGYLKTRAGHHHDQP